MGSCMLLDSRPIVVLAFGLAKERLSLLRISRILTSKISEHRRVCFSGNSGLESSGSEILHRVDCGFANQEWWVWSSCRLLLVELRFWFS
jgi:hypothetical protein